MRTIAGDTLYVNLTEGRSWREPVDPDLVRSYLGGRGISARYLWDLLGRAWIP